MRITKVSDSETRFAYESTSFRFSGVCNRAVIVALGSGEIRSEPSRARGPRLSATECLEHMFASVARNSDTRSVRPVMRHIGNILPIALATQPCRWNRPISDTPIELLGLARSIDITDQSVGKTTGGTIDGPSLLTELMDHARSDRFQSEQHGEEKRSEKVLADVKCQSPLLPGTLTPLSPRFRGPVA